MPKTVTAESAATPKATFLFFSIFFRIYRTRAPASLRLQPLAQPGRSPRFEDHPTFTTHRSSRSPERPMAPLLNRLKHAKSNKMPHSNERQEARLDYPAKIKFTCQHPNIIRELANI